MRITSDLSLDDSEISFSFIRSSGPGGQNVNKVSTAVVLRFDLKHSSLPQDVRERALILLASRLTSRGVLIIKAGSYRTQETNKQDALKRLQGMLLRAAKAPKKRKKTKPSYASKQKRLNEKKLHSRNKSLRQQRFDHE